VIFHTAKQELVEQQAAALIELLEKEIK